MAEPDRREPNLQLLPVYGLLLGVGLGVLLSALELMDFLLAVVAGAAVGLVVGAAVYAWYDRR
jgi:hypothetical protein